MTQLLHKACECVFRMGRVGGDISMSTLQCNEHHPSQTYIEAALTVTCGSQSQRRRSPCCHWPRTPCFKATFYSLLRAFPVCWQMLLALPLTLQTASFTPAASFHTSPSHSWLSHSPKLALPRPTPQLPSMFPCSLVLKRAAERPTCIGAVPLCHSEFMSK